MLPSQSLAILELVRGCRYCQRVMECSSREYEENPFCRLCLNERLAKEAAHSRTELDNRIGGAKVESMERKNKTTQDAYERVLDALMGCFADATSEYLDALRLEIDRWAESVREEQARRLSRCQLLEENSVWEPTL